MKFLNLLMITKHKAWQLLWIDSDHCETVRSGEGGGGEGKNNFPHPKNPPKK